MNVLITICARGGSKGVKNKNIRVLKDKPLIAFTILQAKKWGKTEDIVVSTDSEAIASVASEWGAKVPFIRPSELAQDDSPKVPVIRHALITCEKLWGVKYDLIIDLDVTSPVRTAHDIENCMNKFISNKLSTLFSVVRAHKNPYFNMVEEDGDGFVHISKKLPENVYSRQKAPQVYGINGSIYCYSRDFLIDEKNTMPFSDRTMVYEMDDIAGFDVDREVDFKFLEFLLKEGVADF